MTPTPSPIAFIGGGNMARSLTGGVSRRGFDTSRIRVAEPVAELRQALVADFGGRQARRDPVMSRTRWRLLATVTVHTSRSMSSQSSAR